MKSQPGNRKRKPSPSATASSAEPLPEAASTTPEAEPTTDAPRVDREAPTEPPPAPTEPPQAPPLHWLNYIPLASLHTKPVYVTPMAGAKPEQTILLQRAPMDPPHVLRGGWDIRLTAMGVMIHRAGAPIQWIPLEQCWYGEVDG